jgi:hypothetical protein
MQKTTSPLKLTVDNAVLGQLDQLALQLRQDIRAGKRPKRGPGRSVGAATVAATILERIVRDYPQLLKEFFGDESSLGRGAAELPKEPRRRRAQK